jgi:hypothetical protein
MWCESRQSRILKSTVVSYLGMCGNTMKRILRRSRLSIFPTRTISTLPAAFACYYKNSTPTPKLSPFLASSFALTTKGKLKLISNLAIG